MTSLERNAVLFLLEHVAKFGDGPHAAHATAFHADIKEEAENHIPGELLAMPAELTDGTFIPNGDLAEAFMKDLERMKNEGTITQFVDEFNNYVPVRVTSSAEPIRATSIAVEDEPPAPRAPIDDLHV